MILHFHVRFVVNQVPTGPTACTTLKAIEQVLCFTHSDEHFDFVTRKHPH